jgi:hypothetical protein
VQFAPNRVWQSGRGFLENQQHLDGLGELLEEHPMKPSLTPEQDLEAKQLEAKINFAIAKEVADLARLLVSKGETDLFGATEYQVRDLVLRIGAKAYIEHLREKKMVTKDPPSIAPAAATKRTSRTIGR